MMEGGHRRLRSALWSSETLAKGLGAIDIQQSLLVEPKDEEDEELVQEFLAPW